MKIAFALTQVAGIAAAAVDASATTAASTSGGVSVFAGLVVSDKGRPFELLRVTEDNWQEVLGKVRRPGAPHTESLRCLEEALKGGNGYVVRVVPAAATYPVANIGADSAGENAVEFTSVVFGNKPTLGEGKLMAIYPVDGDNSARSVSLTAVSDEVGMFNLTLTGATSTNWKVSFNREAVDDNGDSLFITDVLERTNAPLRAVVAPAVAPGAITGFGARPFAGGVVGDDIALGDYQKGIRILNNALVDYTAVVSLGITDPEVTKALTKMADDHRIDMFGDLDANSWAAAVEAMTGAGFNDERLSMYFFPYMTKCPYYKVHMHWPISGIAFTAKAKGIAKVEGGVGGYHYAPAGMERGVISRTEPRPFEGLDEPDLDALVKCRLNRLDLTTSGQLMIGDSLTTRQKDDYLRFQHISSTMNAITRDYAKLAKQVQHEPDGVTYDTIMRGMTDILDGYVASGALVKPRDPADGESPYALKVVQTDIDLWTVYWWVCVTGTARRIQGQPALFR